MKPLAAMLALGLGLGGCSNRTHNLYVRYSGVVALVGGAAMIAGPYLNGEGSTDGSEAKGFDTRLPGAGVALVGAGLVIASYLVHPAAGAPLDREAQHQREITLQADALLHQAETAAGQDDCATVNQLAPQIALLDPGVAAVLRANVAAARCLAARDKLPLSEWLRKS